MTTMPMFQTTSRNLPIPAAPILLFLVLAFLMSAIWPVVPLHAQSAEMMAELAKYKVVHEGGRDLVEVKLRDVLAMALQRSTVVKASQIGEEAALHALLAARERNRPTLTNKLEQAKSLARTSSGLCSQVPDAALCLSTPLTQVLSSEYAKTQENGIRWSLKYAETQLQPNVVGFATLGGSPVSQENPSYNLSGLTAGVTVPFLQGFGGELGALPERRGELGVTRSRHATRRDTNTLLRTMALVYWNMVAVLENIRVQEESVKLSGQLLRDNQQRLAAGVLSPADVKVTENQLARDRQTLLQLQNEAFRIEDQARAALNLENLQLGFKPTDVPTVRKVALDFKVLREKTFAVDPDVGLLHSALADSGYNLVEARNKDKSNLDLNLFYVLNGFADSAFGGTSGFSESALGGYGATLTWTVPLFNRQAEENIQKALLERARLEQQMDGLKTTLSIRLQSELRSLQLAKQEVETAQVSVSLAQELLQNEIERFKLGRSTSFQVAQTQRDLAQARQREILARISFESTYVDMLVLTGEIFPFYSLPEPLTGSTNRNAP